MKDADVRRCSIFARGLLIDLLCLCFESKRRGVLCEADGVTPWSNDDIVNALSGGSREQLLEGMAELERKGVLSRDDNGCLYSRRMVRDEEIRGKRAESGSIGGKQNGKQTGSKTEANSEANHKQITEDEDEDEEHQEIKKVVSRFTPPSLEDVQAYSESRAAAGNAIADPEAFHDFYQSKGWKVGDQSMKDWQAAYRNFGRNAPAAATKSRGDPADPRGTIAAGKSYLAKRQKGLLNGDSRNDCDNGGSAG